MYTDHPSSWGTTGPRPLFRDMTLLQDIYKYWYLHSNKGSSAMDQAAKGGYGIPWNGEIWDQEMTPIFKSWFRTKIDPAQSNRLDVTRNRFLYKCLRDTWHAYHSP